MRTAEELYRIWAPTDSIWSDWVAPAFFTEVGCPDLLHDLPAATTPEILWLPAMRDTAIVLDLPGTETIRLALRAIKMGYRPVSLFNASPGPFIVGTRNSRCVIDMQDLLTEFCSTTSAVAETRLAPDAPPAFLLDSRRLGTNTVDRELFDNRWKVFPQDFPSAVFLRDHGIFRALLVQRESLTPKEDLAHVLRLWQESGIEILSKDVANDLPARAIQVQRPSRFRRAWYRVFAMWGLLRNSAGGFGDFWSESGAG